MQAVLVGHKAQRDFGVYSWAFMHHRFRVIRPLGGILVLEGSVSLAMLKGIGVVLCHSIFTANCFRRGGSNTQTTTGAFDPTEYVQATRAFPRMLAGRKLNRISGVRQVLTTKDGLCNTLHTSRLPEDRIQMFSFPCWSIPSHEAALRARMNEAGTNETTSLRC